MLDSLSTILITFVKEEWFSFAVCFSLILFLYLLYAFKQKGKLMSDQTMNTSRRPHVPNIKSLPPLVDSVRKANVQTPQVQQNVRTEQPPQPQQPQVPELQPQQSPQGDGDVTIPAIETREASTYLSIGTERNGNVEFDLMSHREKGQEVRYLNIQVQGFSLDEKGKVNHTYMSIASKEDFEKIKSFFSTIKWED